MFNLLLNININLLYKINFYIKLLKQMSYTKWLNETNLDEVHLVGKNASLGTMIQNLQSLNINIPNGFVITTLGYDYFLEFNNLKEKIIELMDQLIIEKNLKLIGKQIRNLIQNSSFPNDFINEIQKSIMN